MSLNRVFQIYGVTTFQTIPARFFCKSKEKKEIKFFRTQEEADAYNQVHLKGKGDSDYYWAFEDKGETKIISNRGEEYNKVAKKFKGRALVPDSQLQKTMENHTQNGERILIGVKKYRSSRLLYMAPSNDEAEFFLKAYPLEISKHCKYDCALVALDKKPVVFTVFVADKPSCTRK